MIGSGLGALRLSVHWSACSVAEALPINTKSTSRPRLSREIYRGSESAAPLLELAELGRAGGEEQGDLPGALLIREILDHQGLLRSL